MEMMQNPYLEEYLNYWFFQIEKNLIKPSTVSTFYTLISRHIIPKLGHLRLSELNLFILQQFFNQKYENGRLDQKGGLSYQTLNSIYSILNLALNYAVCNELVQKNYCQDVRLPKPQWKSVRVFSKSEQKKIETAALNSKNPNGIGIILCLYTGIRIGELCGLHMEDINLENRILYIRRTLERIVCISDNAGKTCIYEGYPKSRSSIRDIPIPAFLIPLLQNYCNTYRMNASAQAPFICGKKGKS